MGFLCSHEHRPSSRLRPGDYQRHGTQSRGALPSTFSGICGELRREPDSGATPHTRSARRHARRADLRLASVGFPMRAGNFRGRLAGTHRQSKSPSKVAAAARRYTPDARTRTACPTARKPQRKGPCPCPTTTSPGPMATSPRGPTSTMSWLKLWWDANGLNTTDLRTPLPQKQKTLVFSVFSRVPSKPYVEASNPFARFPRPLPGPPPHLTSLQPAPPRGHAALPTPLQKSKNIPQAPLTTPANYRTLPPWKPITNQTSTPSSTSTSTPP